MRVLYVSDLDGTLLRSDQKTSGYTNRTINALVRRGMLFSYATARSSVTSKRVTQGLNASFPIIVYNGAFIKDNRTDELLLKNFFVKDEAAAIIEDLTQNAITPIVYAFIDGKERFSYLTSSTRAAKEFLGTRDEDPRVRIVREARELTRGEIFYITCIDDAEKLRPFFEAYRARYHCVFQCDIYSGEQWLEIMPAQASKANAVTQLAKLLECDHIVVFGDGVNDIDMFEIADEAYATQNAVPELKKVATGIIASNDSDGVARWLLERYKNQTASNPEEEEGMRIRRFKETDAKEVSDLIAKTLRTTNIKDYSHEYIENDVRILTPEYLIQRSQWTHFYVVCDGDIIIGCGAIGPYWGKEDESSLFTIFVLPEYQGKGIGRRIIQTLEQDEFFLRAKRVEIPASITACAFYRKMGYDYKNGVTAVDEEELFRLEKFR